MAYNNTMMPLIQFSRDADYNVLGQLFEAMNPDGELTSTPWPVALHLEDGTILHSVLVIGHELLGEVDLFPFWHIDEQTGRPIGSRRSVLADKIIAVEIA